MTRQDWLKSLTVGDEVAITRALHTPEIKKVLRTTGTQIVVDCGSRFDRETGYEKGKGREQTATVPRC